MMTFLLLLSAAVAACDVASTVTDVRRALDTGYHAWVTQEKSSFYVAVTTARSSVLCLKEPLDRSTAARFYFQEALFYFLENNEEGAVESFASVLSTEPTFQLPAALAPGRHPLHARLASARARTATETAPLPTPATGYVLVDGLRDVGPPTDRSWVFQLVDERDAALQTTWVQRGQAPPTYPVLQAASAPSQALSTGSMALVATAVGAGLTAAVLYGIAAEESALYKDPSTPCTDLDAIRDRTNLLVISSGVAGGAAVTATLAAVAIRF